MQKQKRKFAESAGLGGGPTGKYSYMNYYTGYGMPNDEKMHTSIF